MEASVVQEGRTRFQQAARDLLRESLLDAAGELLIDAAWSDISMAAIAERAGVSRQTLYNEFGSRDEFSQNYALREADHFLATVEEAIGRWPDQPLRTLREGFEVFLTEAEQNPMVRQIVVRDPGADELLSLFTTRGGPVVDLATARLTARICEVWPQATEHDAKTLAVGIVRLGISHAGLPNDSVANSAQQVVELIAPFIENALGDTASD